MDNQSLALSKPQDRIFSTMPKVSVNKVATLSGHQDCVYVLEKAPDNTKFFSSGGDGVVAEWDLDNPTEGTMLAKLNHSVYALCYYPERNVLIVGENFEGIHLIDLNERKELASIKLKDTAIFDIQVFDDRIFCALGNGEIHVLNLRTLQTVDVIKKSDASVRALAISEHHGHVVAAYSDQHIRVFELDRLEMIYEIKAHKISVFTIQYSPDQRFLISGSRDAHLKVWEVDRSYQLYEEIAAHMYAINHLSYSADGKHFVTCSMDKSIKVWDAETFQLLKVIDKARHAGHGTSVNRVLWTNHNNLIVSASDDRSISIWDLTFNLA
jgi:WD40 repeat protein